MGAPAITGAARINNRFPCSLAARGGASWFLTWGECRHVSRGCASGVTQVVCPPLRWCCVQRACAVPCSCSRIFKRGSWVFWSLCIFCPQFATTAHACAYLLVLCINSFFVFCCLRRSVSRCKHRSKGSQVPACLTQTVSLLCLYLLDSTFNYSLE